MGATPRVVDWDDDGRKDLLTGGRDGYVRVYLNTNTDADPVFNGYFNIQVGSGVFDAGLTSTPFVVDFNSDGKKDLICGEDYGKVWLLVNTGTNANPTFSSAVYLKAGINDLDVGSKSAPAMADFDRDGKKDLLVGDYYGNIYFYKNMGSATNPMFNSSTMLQAGGTTLDVEYYARIDIVDWDGDGVLDIISGNRNYNASPSGGIWFFHALGPLSVDDNTISHSTGGTLNFALRAGSGYSGRRYFLLGNATGTEPGTPLPGGGTLPLNYDAVFRYIMNNYNKPMFTDFRGTLDGSGEGTASLTAASLPLAAGLVLHFAYTTEVPYDFQSNPVGVEILP